MAEWSPDEVFQALTRTVAAQIIMDDGQSYDLFGYKIRFETTWFGGKRRISYIVSDDRGSVLWVYNIRERPLGDKASLVIEDQVSANDFITLLLLRWG